MKSVSKGTIQRAVTGLDNCPKDAPDHRILLEHYQLTNNDTGLEKRYPINDPKTSNIQKDGQQYNATQ